MTAVQHSAKQVRRSTPIPATDPMTSKPAQPFLRLSQGAGTAYETVLARGPDNVHLERQVQRLMDRILEQLPMNQRAAILLAGVSNDQHTADIAGLLASELARQQCRDTLLVDADGERRVLSQRFAAVGELALTDVLLKELPLGRGVLHSLVDHLHVLPYGKATPTRRTLQRTRVESLVDQLKKNYPYVIVSAGRSRDALVESFGRYCDATYLIFQLGHAEQLDIAETIEFFTRGGARLLGSIVTGTRT